MTFDAWFVFVAAATLISLSPGANNLLALTNGLRYGATPSLAAVGGRLGAFVVMIVIAALGLGAVLAASELAFQIIKWAGVAYLVYLGLRAFLAPAAAATPGGQRGGAVSGAQSWATLARREFLVAVGNPKAILVFTAVFPQFLVAGEAALPQFAVMGLTFLVTECLAAFTYVFSGKVFAPLLRDRAALVNRITGGLLLAAAGLLASASRRA
ncbi:LysE family transporter [Pelagibius litoralis]|uniref:LysE family transporter n=1 Tax=Pelagibius litoralis TaxID=374515 RepID=A0A967C1X7_9PROT|nr:LysE family transporter [Pelagibius litoralis]NIA68236.1 LysE family transporter [Pelagibius litoralis]